MNLKGIHLTWLGHATFRIETPGGQTVIIDPWIMNNPACPPSEKKVKKVDIHSGYSRARRPHWRRR